MKKQLVFFVLILCGIGYSQTKKEDEVADFDTKKKLEEIFFLKDQLLVKTSKYDSKTRTHDIKYFPYIENQLSEKELVIEQNSDLISLKENKTNYYALTVGDTEAKIWKSLKSKLSWELIYSIKKSSEDHNYLLDVYKDKIALISNTYLSHNFKNNKVFDRVDSFKVIYDSAKLKLSHNQIIIGDDKGEFGGQKWQLSGLLYKKRKFVFNNLKKGNINKIVNYKKGFMVLGGLSHLGSVRNNIYQINDIQKMETILHSKATYRYHRIPTKEENKYKLKKELLRNAENKYNWSKDLLENRIHSLLEYEGEVYILVSKKGIYKMDKNKLIKKIISFDLNKCYKVNSEYKGKERSYISCSRATDLKIKNGQIYVLYGGKNPIKIYDLNP